MPPLAVLLVAMKVKTFFTSLLLIAALALAVGLGGFWGITSRNPLALLKHGGQSLPQATKFVPRRAPLVASVLASPDRLINLWKLLAAPSLRNQTQTEIDLLKSYLLAGTGLSYENDIRPWINQEITFALVTPDIDEDGSNGQQPGYLIVLSCRDRNLAQETLDLYWQRRAIAGDSLVLEEFAGSQLISARQTASYTDVTEIKAENFTQASTIIGDRFVLLANSTDVLKQALTTVQSPDLRLSDDSGFQSSFASLPSQRVGMVVINLPQSLRWLGLVADNRPPTNGLGTEDNLFDRTILSLRLNRQGLVADTAFLAAPGHRFNSHMPTYSTFEAAQLLPTDTSLAAVGYNLAEFWKKSSQFLDQYGLSMDSLAETPFQLFNTKVQSSLLLDWIKTEYAVGLMDTPNSGLNWALMSQINPDTEPALQKLDHIAQQQGFSVGSLQLDDHYLTVWSQLTVANDKRDAQRYPIRINTEITGLRTEISDYTLFSDSATAIDQVLTAKKPLPETKIWLSAINPLAKPNTGYFYLNWPQIVPKLEQKLPWLRLVEAVGQPFLRHVKAIAMTGYNSQSQIRTGAISIYLSNLDRS